MNLASPFISNEDFFSELKKYKGLIPVSIDSASEKITWADLEAYHFYEGFFHKSLDIYYGLKKNAVVSFTTNLNILEDDRIITEHIYPTAFIFHAGRCGSTLLSKVLARSRQNLLISEAEPLNQILDFFAVNNGGSDINTERNKHIYKNLLLCMAKKRVSEHKHFFIKFTSYNIYFFNFISSVFPDVKAIFLTRDKREILASFNKNPAPWLNKTGNLKFEIFSGTNAPDLKAIIDSFFAIADNQSTGVLKQIDYKMLKAENMPDILSCLNISPNEKQLNLMKSQFKYNSKTEFNKKLFNQ